MATKQGVVAAFILFQCMLAIKEHLSTAAFMSENYVTEWEEWKTVHGRSYSDDNEEGFRREVWMQNLKNIEENRMQFESSFVMGMNNLGDLTEAEYRRLMLGKKIRGEKAVIDGSIFQLRPNYTALPETVDWRAKGCVTDVKSQISGDAWSFSAVGSLEGQHCIHSGELLSLNEEKLRECCSSCNLVDDAFRYMIAHNHDVDSKNAVTNCNFSAAAFGASLTGYLDIVPRGSEYKLQFATAKIGPISVAIDASHSTFQLYVGGVYDEPACSSTQLDHTMLVVGYGTSDGKDYWLVKNSWGITWGMNGYIMMTRNKDNQCGIATLASYPTGVTSEKLFANFGNSKADQLTRINMRSLVDNTE